MSRRQRRTVRKQASPGTQAASTAARTVFVEAVQHHKAGHLDDAERLYRKALDLRPGYAESYYNLGLALTALARQDEAIACYEGAIHARPDYPEAHNNLGILLGARGRLNEAASCYRAAINANPHYPEALNNLGNALKTQGQFDEAVGCFRTALDIRPGYPEADNNLGIVLRGQGLLQEAIACHRRAIDRKPDYAEARNNLGIALKELGALDEAVACYRSALAINPNYPEAHNNLGITLKELGRLDEAVACYRKAIEINPNYAEAHNNLAISAQRLGRMQEALACYHRAIEVSPNFPQTYSNLGTALQEQGRLQEAAVYYRKAIALKPDYPDAHNNLAMALLTQGDLAAGWAENEWRWKTPQMIKVRRDFPQPQWRGEPAAGRTLLIHAEQGYGDTLQFCRYAPLAAARGLRVILQVPRPLVRLLRGLSGVDLVVQDGEALPEFDLHCPMLSLPLAFGTVLASIPSAERYLFADTAQIEAQRTRLAALGSKGRRVGLVWAGNARNIADHRRSLPADRLRPLFGVPGLGFFSLQKDGPAIPEQLIDLMGGMADFADTAALIANLDLVISVDTAVAHLAAALGKPVWLLDRFDPCWRWLTGRTDSPWYPTLRLFRQSKPGDWDTVIAEVAAALQVFADNQSPEATPPDNREAFAEAVQHHQRGQLADAERLYRQVLTAAPRHADCLHLLGVIGGQTGRHDLAIEMIGRAIAIDPKQAPYHSNLGISFRHQNRLDDAVACFRAAVDLTPDDPKSHNNLGIALKNQGRPDEAIICYRRALDLKPDYNEARDNLNDALRQRPADRTPDDARTHFNRGSALRAQGRTDEAIASYRRALQLRPDIPEAHNNLGNALQEQGRLDEAAACYRRAIDLRPRFAEADNNLGTVLQKQGQLEEAEARYRRAIDIKRNYPEAHNNLATVLREQGRLEEAVVHCRTAIGFDPDFGEAHNTLGTTLQELARLDEAVACFRRTVDLRPDYPEAHRNLAMGLLAQGDLAAGWVENEWRWQTPQLIKVRRDFAQPQWIGQPADGQTLLIHAEQGFGDSLQFCRYAPLAAARGLRVIVEVPTPLVRLFDSLPGVDRVIGSGEALPHFDLHCPMLSLPLAFGTTLATIPSALSYLQAPATRVAAWRTRLAAMQRRGRRIGLVWAGSPHTNLPVAAAVDRRRSIAPDRLAPLLDLPGLQFFSLQKDHAAAPGHLTDFMNEMADFADTAALVANLDLVISVDTAVAHLAASLGKPVWLLDRFDPCWRWLTGRTDSPWYPTLRLFRQPKPGDWDAVIEDVRAALLRFASDRPPA
jgi:tetratricopeptide (TPR) repeat protein